MIFRPEWIQFYETEPRDLITTMTVDLAGIPKPGQKVSTLRPYSPGGELNALAATLKGLPFQRLVLIVYGVDYQGI